MRKGVRKVWVLLLTACLGGSTLGSLQAAPRDRELRELKKEQKRQRKSLKAEQRASNQLFKRQGVAGVERQRFKKQMKMQRRVLRKGQREQVRNLKQSKKFMKQNHRQ
jgi:hypothetical protein